MSLSTIKISYTDIPKSDIAYKNCKIEIFDGNCFDASNKYTNSVIHNFANNTRPGGPSSLFGEDGKLQWNSKSSNTQEDQIIRIYKNNILLYPQFYPICDDSKINGEALLYSECNELYPIITIAAPINPNFQNKRTINTIINRIELMLYVSWKYKKILITGLWGCGAFGAQPQKMIDLWQEAISKSKYLPEKIVFAIMIDDLSKKWGDTRSIIKQFLSLKV
jgi:hypothetical protein